MRGTRQKKIKRITPAMRGSLFFVFFVIIVLFVALIARLLYIKNEDGERYAKRVLSQQTYVSSVLPFRRGEIRDRNGTKLAYSEKVYNLVIDPNVILSQVRDEKESKEKKEAIYKQPYKEPTTMLLLNHYDIEPEELENIWKEKPNSRYVVLRKELSFDEMDKFEKLQEEDKNIKGIWFEETYTRRYPMKTVGSNVLGFTQKNSDIGNWGIEQYYNSELNGTNGREYGYFDSELQLERNVKPAVNGNTVVSTIDANIQQIVEKHITKFRNSPGAEDVGVVLMNPKNGEIIAMACNDQFDLNNPRDLTPFYKQKEIDAMTEEKKSEALSKLWRNFCITDAIEPGSTFKPFTVAMGLEEGILKGNETYLCDGFYTPVKGGKPVKCNKVHGTITLQQSLMLSCNDVMMQISYQYGRTMFTKYVQNFGFGTKTGIDLLGETTGILVKEEKLNQYELATSSFGQSNTVNMVQMAAGISALVNGGHYYKPHIVKQILNENGAMIQNADPILVKEVVSRKTSEMIVKDMYATVKDGTAKKAQVEGYTIGGKTGTAETYPRANRKYLVSFIGFAPVEDPQLVVYVVVDKPNVAEQADSKYAQILASDIMKEVFPFLDIYPTEKKTVKKTEEKAQ